MTKSNKGSKTKTDLSQTNAPEVICPSCGYSQILSWRGKYLHLQCTVCQTQWMPEIVARVLGPRLTENELNELRADLAAPADETGLRKALQAIVTAAAPIVHDPENVNTFAPS